MVADPQLIGRLLELPEDERAEIADALLDSLHGDHVDEADDDVRRAWATEITRRVLAHEDGSARTVDGPTALAELRARLARRAP